MSPLDSQRSDVVDPILAVGEGSASSGDSWRASTLSKVLDWVLILGVPIAIGTTVVTAWFAPDKLLSAPFLLMLAHWMAVAPIRRFVTPLKPKAILFTLTMGLSIGYASVNFGVAAGPLLGGALITSTAGVFLGRRALVATLFGTTTLLAGAGALLASGWVEPVHPEFVVAPVGEAWFRSVFAYLFVGGSVASVSYYLMRELERHESALSRRMRLEALGRLAGGVAHDFNNSLHVMYAWTDLLEEHPDTQVQAAMADIRGAADRASRLTRQLMAAGRQDIGVASTFALAAFVRNWVGSMRQLVSRGVELEVHALADPWLSCDPVHLEQVLLNLVVNARDALKEGGRIQVVVDSLPAGHPEGLQASGSARLRVIDNGPGIPEAIRNQLFEPFFTTKGEAGSGMGLAIVTGIVSRAEGTVGVTSQRGRTEFTVCLPALEGEAGTSSEQTRGFDRAPDQSPVALKLVHDESEPVRPLMSIDGEPGTAEAPTKRVVRTRTDDEVEEGSMVVLLAEDEPTIRRMMTFSLERAGWTVLSAQDGDEALEHLETYASRIGVLCTDASMPGAGVGGVIDHYQQLHPLGRVVVCSGYFSPDLERRKTEGSGIEFLPKPFTPSQLLKLLGTAHQSRGMTVTS